MRTYLRNGTVGLWDCFLLLPAQDYVAKFLSTFKEFPPRQKAASFTIDQVMEKMKTVPVGR